MPTFDSDVDLDRKAAQGDQAAISERRDRQYRRERDDYREFLRSEAQAAAAPASGAGLGLFALLAVVAVPLFIVYALVTVLAAGVSALANESLLAPLFPRTGDGIVRYVASVVTLMVLIPGGLVALAGALRGSRLHILRRSVIYPLAFLSAPALLLMTTATTTADVVRLVP